MSLPEDTYADSCAHPERINKTRRDIGAIILHLIGFIAIHRLFLSGFETLA
jgi:hypothetical protein